MSADAQERGSRVSARWRIVGWIVLTTAIALLAVVVTMRSLLQGQVDQAADAGIVQEVEEFRTFVDEGVDPRTAQPFASEAELMERYLSRQTPATHEAFIAVADGDVSYLDNAADDAGELLAADAAELDSLLADPSASGVRDTEHGSVRWGRVDTEDGSAFLVLQFTDPAHDDVDQQVLLLVGVAAGGLALTALIAWFAAGQILLPVRRIAAVAQRVSGHDLSPRVPVEGRDDISSTAQAVNGMLDRLEDSFDRQSHVAAEVERHLARPLEACRRDLETGSQGSDGLSSAELSRLRRRMQEMQRSLADLSLLADAQRPGALRMRPTAAAPLVVRLRHDLAQRFPRRSWELDDAPDLTAPMDAAAVSAAMSQLARNAVDHTEDGERIQLSAAVAEPQSQDDENAEVSAAAQGRVLRLSVTNAGRPLSAEQARAMIEQYRSAALSEASGGSSSTEESADVGGMGLGLAVARAVTDAHGGSLWVASEPDGRTSVGLDLPLVQPDRQELDETDSATQDRVAEAMRVER
ncbi:HAMP domain-containing histidine kinase [Kocuria palustris]|uniref:HAMP domain-containing histidine kinase n=1 Tax=Kocuria palustris TaxID=71999 RepID=UPI0021A2B7ED|nr:HAMP domain-containing histidine kinase [Kocuria palustris]MCT1590707.1 HAMP domain-containing histidine kinase [Kocuria palustris]